MSHIETLLLALITVITVAAGAECIYCWLAGQPGIAIYAAAFLALGLLSGRLMWQ